LLVIAVVLMSMYFILAVYLIATFISRRSN